MTVDKADVLDEALAALRRLAPLAALSVTVGSFILDERQMGALGDMPLADLRLVSQARVCLCPASQRNARRDAGFCVLQVGVGAKRAGVLWSTPGLQGGSSVRTWKHALINTAAYAHLRQAPAPGDKVMQHETLPARIAGLQDAFNVMLHPLRSFLSNNE